MPPPTDLRSLALVLLEDPYELPTLIGRVLADPARPELQIVSIPEGDVADLLRAVRLPDCWDAALVSVRGTAHHLDQPGRREPVVLVHGVARDGHWHLALRDASGEIRDTGGVPPELSLGRIDDALRHALGLPRAPLVPVIDWPVNRRPARGAGRPGPC